MKVILSNQAKKFLDNLRDEKARQILWDTLNYLPNDPIPYKLYDLTKLKGSESSYRLRKGDFRISYAFDISAQLLYVTEIARREQAYKKI